MSLDIEELRDRLENLTPGKWEFFSIDDDSSVYPIATIRVEGTNQGVVLPNPGSFGQIRGRRADLEFIADAPDIVRQLLDLIERYE